MRLLKVLLYYKTEKNRNHITYVYKSIRPKSNIIYFKCIVIIYFLLCLFFNVVIVNFGNKCVQSKWLVIHNNLLFLKRTYIKS